jgi:hypothetical protein
MKGVFVMFLHLVGEEANIRPPVSRAQRWHVTGVVCHLVLLDYAVVVLRAAALG